MTQVYPLDPVIRRVARPIGRDELRPETMLVAFDARARRVLARPPLLGLGRDIRYFIVSTRRVPVAGRGPACRLRSPRTQLHLDVEVSYLAYCEPGNEGRLVSALHHGEHPATVLNEFLDDHIHAFEADQARAGRDICLDFATLIAPLRRHLSECALQKLGLSLEVDVHPRLDERASNVPVVLDFFAVRVADHDQELLLKLKCDTEVPADLQILALLHHAARSTFGERIQRTARTILAAEFTLHAFAFDLSGRVRARLIEAINADLAKVGRRISYLQLESPSTAQLPAVLEEVEHTTSCKLRDWSETVKVNHRLQLSLQDLGRFRTASVTSVRDWACDKLDEITRTVLFEMNYVELLSDGILDQIRATMQRASTSIGYALKQLITLPDLEPLTWRQGVLWDDNEVTCQTEDAQVEVRLNFVVRGRITRLHEESLRRYLTPNSRLRDDVRDAIRAEAQGLLHSVDPERFYMRFDDTEHGPALRQQLQSAVQDMLASRFLLDDASVIAKPLETELTKRLTALQQGFHKLEVTTLSLRDSGLEEQVPYRIIFRVMGVDPEGWHQFRAMEFPSSASELEHLKELLHECARGVLDTLPTNFLQYREYRAKRELHALLQASADRLLKQVGLVISIVEVRRDTTLGEASEQRKLLKDIEINTETALEAARISAETRQTLLKELQKRESELVATPVDPDDMELRRLRDAIQNLRTELEAYPSPAAKQHVRLPPGRSTSVDFTDYLRDVTPRELLHDRRIADGRDGD